MVCGFAENRVERKKLVNGVEGLKINCGVGGLANKDKMLAEGGVTILRTQICVYGVWENIKYE